MHIPCYIFMHLWYIFFSSIHFPFPFFSCMLFVRFYSSIGLYFFFSVFFFACTNTPFLYKLKNIIFLGRFYKLFHLRRLQPASGSGTFSLSPVLSYVWSHNQNRMPGIHICHVQNCKRHIMHPQYQQRVHCRYIL